MSPRKPAARAERSVAALLGALSPRRVSVLDVLADAPDIEDKEIAAQLGISVSSVRQALTALYAATGSRRVGLVLWWLAFRADYAELLGRRDEEEAA